MVARPSYDADLLEGLYWDEGLSTYDIADRYDVTPTTVLGWMDKHNIDRRAAGHGVRKKSRDKRAEPEVLEDLYWDEGLSLREVGDELDVTAPTIQRWMDQYGIDRRSPTYDRGGRNHVPLRSDSKGYIGWSTTHNGQHEYSSVHRLLAISEHGIDAVKHKDVHHINGIPFDNRPENLEVVTRADHHYRQEYSYPRSGLWVLEGLFGD